ncbi:MAG: hypothetical protein COV59_03060 [Candidatus Magasanikbacteria bacterium CG11_big_fil_rev_8_21_14_0_20_39_34]|uniref:DNA 3'-5' helicase n=1 Tax=Candidatus Magasanikbacteria bacterium CG11_big_fil_rev_8_21_14_0_20_39_34 TaxID=1974653 RepID=A0A2H0N5I2_9BACT|nr:MAG: hypothetical protein COV59_03060 [Candidatus Magasanikbacteria bacterium CG11_big_fil_rev_8_21_14_0_20_39_34]
MDKKQTQLNAAQKEAVLYFDNPLLIIAGAGTGKTTVISEKIAHIIKSQLGKAEEILAITFTEKAASEMEERVDALLETGYLDMQISTFHNFCKKIIENFGIDIGLSTQFRLLTQTECWLLVQENLDLFPLEYYKPLGNPTKHIHDFISHFQKCKDEMISPEEYLEYVNKRVFQEDEADEKKRLLEIAQAYKVYNQLLLDNACMDFADLIYYSVKLLEERPMIKKEFSQRFKYILLDEFQDVNWSQYRLIQCLSEHAHLTVVGDDDQAIYAFRGASVSNILRFKEDFPTAHEVVLSENYRSAQPILDAAHTLVQHNNPDRLEVKLQLDKKLISQKKQSSQKSVEHFHFDTQTDLIFSVAQEILRLKQDNKDAVWDDFALLVRANGHATPYIDMLQKAKIPYEFLAASGLFRQPLVLDCVNFFRVLDQHKEDSAMYRLLRLPFLELKESDIQKITFASKKKSLSYYVLLKRAAEFGVSQEGIHICNKVVNIIHDGMKNARGQKPSTLLYQFLEQSGYLSYLTQKEEEGNAEIIRQIYQLKQFFELLTKYEQTTTDPHLKHFMKNYEHILDAGDEGQLYQPTDTPDSVNIMTVHAAKGLEFRYVFILDAVEERFPSRSQSKGIEVPEELIHEQISSHQIHYQEERRLMYVALTRAKERVYLCSADDYGGQRKKKISRFIGESGIDIAKEKNLQKNMEALFSIADTQTNISQEKQGVVYDIPKVFSFSQIKAYETCPYQYKLAHILKIPTKGSASFSFGNTMHKTLQDFYKLVQEKNSAKQVSLFAEFVQPPRDSNTVQVPSLEELLALYKRNWIDDWFKSTSQKDSYFEKGKEILQTFYAAQEGNWSVPVGLESWFKIQVGDYLLHGRIDRIDQHDDKSIEIIDYKTGATKEKLTSEDKEQLLIYQIAAESLPEYRHIGPVSKLTFYYLNDNVKTSFIGENKDLEKLQAKIVKTIDGIHTKDFTAKPNKFTCKFCDFKEICEYREL